MGWIWNLLFSAKNNNEQTLPERKIWIDAYRTEEGLKLGYVSGRLELFAKAIEKVEIEATISKDEAIFSLIFDIHHEGNSALSQHLKKFVKKFLDFENASLDYMVKTTRREQATLLKLEKSGDVTDTIRDLQKHQKMLSKKIQEKTYLLQPGYWIFIKDLTYARAYLTLYPKARKAAEELLDKINDAAFFAREQGTFSQYKRCSEFESEIFNKLEKTLEVQAVETLQKNMNKRETFTRRTLVVLWNLLLTLQKELDEGIIEANKRYIKSHKELGPAFEDINKTLVDYQVSLARRILISILERTDEEKRYKILSEATQDEYLLEIHNEFEDECYNVNNLPTFANVLKYYLKTSQPLTVTEKRGLLYPKLDDHTLSADTIIPDSFDEKISYDSPEIWATVRTDWEALQKKFFLIKKEFLFDPQNVSSFLAEWRYYEDVLNATEKRLSTLTIEYKNRTVQDNDKAFSAKWVYVTQKIKFLKEKKETVSKELQKHVLEQISNLFKEIADLLIAETPPSREILIEKAKQLQVAREILNTLLLEKRAFLQPWSYHKEADFIQSLFKSLIKEGKLLLSFEKFVRIFERLYDIPLLKRLSPEFGADQEISAVKQVRDIVSLNFLKTSLDSFIKEPVCTTETDKGPLLISNQVYLNEKILINKEILPEEDSKSLIDLLVLEQYAYSQKLVVEFQELISTSINTDQDSNKLADKYSKLNIFCIKFPQPINDARAKKTWGVEPHLQNMKQKLTGKLFQGTAEEITQNIIFCLNVNNLYFKLNTLNQSIFFAQKEREWEEFILLEYKSIKSQAKTDWLQGNIKQSTKANEAEKIAKACTELFVNYQKSHFRQDLEKESVKFAYLNPGVSLPLFHFCVSQLGKSSEIAKSFFTTVKYFLPKWHQNLSPDEEAKLIILLEYLKIDNVIEDIKQDLLEIANSPFADPSRFVRFVHSLPSEWLQELKNKNFLNVLICIENWKTFEKGRLSSSSSKIKKDQHDEQPLLNNIKSTLLALFKDPDKVALIGYMQYFWPSLPEQVLKDKDVLFQILELARCSTTQDNFNAIKQLIDDKGLSRDLEIKNKLERYKLQFEHFFALFDLAKRCTISIKDNTYQIKDFLKENILWNLSKEDRKKLGENLKFWSIQISKDNIEISKFIMDQKNEVEENLHILLSNFIAELKDFPYLKNWEQALLKCEFLMIVGYADDIATELEKFLPQEANRRLFLEYLSFKFSYKKINELSKKEQEKVSGKTTHFQKLEKIFISINSTKHNVSKQDILDLLDITKHKLPTNTFLAYARLQSIKKFRELFYAGAYNTLLLKKPDLLNAVLKIFLTLPEISQDKGCIDKEKSILVNHYITYLITLDKQSTEVLKNFPQIEIEGEIIVKKSPEVKKMEVLSLLNDLETFPSVSEETLLNCGFLINTMDGEKLVKKLAELFKNKATSDEERFNRRLFLGYLYFKCTNILSNGIRGLYDKEQEPINKTKNLLPLQKLEQMFISMNGAKKQVVSKQDILNFSEMAKFKSIGDMGDTFAEYAQLETIRKFRELFYSGAYDSVVSENPELLNTIFTVFLVLPEVFKNQDQEKYQIGKHHTTYLKFLKEQNEPILKKFLPSISSKKIYSKNIDSLRPLIKRTLNFGNDVVLQKISTLPKNEDEFRKMILEIKSPLETKLLGLLKSLKQKLLDKSLSTSDDVGNIQKHIEKNDVLKKIWTSPVADITAAIKSTEIALEDPAVIKGLRIAYLEKMLLTLKGTLSTTGAINLNETTVVLTYIKQFQEYLAKIEELEVHWILDDLQKQISSSDIDTAIKKIENGPFKGQTWVKELRIAYMTLAANIQLENNILSYIPPQQTNLLSLGEDVLSTVIKTPKLNSINKTVTPQKNTPSDEDTDHDDRLVYTESRSRLFTSQTPDCITITNDHNQLFFKETDKGIVDAQKREGSSFYNSLEITRDNVAEKFTQCMLKISNLWKDNKSIEAADLNVFRFLCNSAANAKNIKLSQLEKNLIKSIAEKKTLADSQDAKCLEEIIKKYIAECVLKKELPDINFIKAYAILTDTPIVLWNEKCFSYCLPANMSESDSVFQKKNTCYLKQSENSEHFIQLKLEKIKPLSENELLPIDFSNQIPQRTSNVSTGTLIVTSIEPLNFSPQQQQPSGNNGLTIIVHTNNTSNKKSN